MPETLCKFKIDYSDIIKIKPNIVYFSLTAYGRSDCSKNNSPQCIANSVYAAWVAGASICRLCINDGRGNVLLSKEQLVETISLIREFKECDIVIACDSFGEASSAGDVGATIFNSAEGIEIGTCTIGTVNYEGDSPIYNTPGYLKDLITTFKTKKIKPECRMLDIGMLGNIKWMLKSDYLSAPLFCQIAMGIVGGVDDTVESLLYTIRNLPAGTVWSASAGKNAQMAIIYSSIVIGGNISIDLTADGECTDVSMIERAVVAIKEFGKDVAASTDAREVLELITK